MVCKRHVLKALLYHLQTRPRKFFWGLAGCENSIWPVEMNHQEKKKHANFTQNAPSRHYVSHIHPSIICNCQVTSLSLDMVEEQSIDNDSAPSAGYKASLQEQRWDIKPSYFTTLNKIGNIFYLTCLYVKFHENGKIWTMIFFNFSPKFITFRTTPQY